MFTQQAISQQVAQAACRFHSLCTGHAPDAVTVVLTDDTLVITLHGALTDAERALAQRPEGAARVRDSQRRLFISCAAPLRNEIMKLTGVEVREATAELEPASGTITQVFTTGTLVEAFQLADSVPAETWSGPG